MQTNILEKKRGRPQKVTKQQVYGTLEEYESITKSELAEEFDVTPATIASRLRELREDGFGVFFDKAGLFVLESVKTNEDLERLKHYQYQIIKTVAGLALCGKPAKKLLLESSKEIRKLLSKDERNSLAEYTSSLTRLLDYTAIAEQMDDDDE